MRVEADAIDHLVEAVGHLIEASDRSKRQETVHFWASIERARASLWAARLEIRAAAIAADG